MLSDAQLKADQQNTQQGRSISKFNAVTHGILRTSLTEYEEGFYSNLLEDLQTDYDPQGVVEQVLIERIAMNYLKLFRLQKAETEFMKQKLNPGLVELKGNELFVIKKEGGYISKINDSHVDRLLNIYSRYETTIENRLFRAIHELERVQSVRRGEKPLQPLAVDINHVSSFGETGQNL